MACRRTVRDDAEGCARAWMEGETGSRTVGQGGTHCPFVPLSPFHCPLALPFLASLCTHERLPSPSPSLHRFTLRTRCALFLLFLLCLRTVRADSVRMITQFILSTLLLAFDVVALKCFAHQPEAVAFALLATLTLPFFMLAGIQLRGE